ncbi:TPA: fimbrial protein [Klebsiella oxytoca]|nr:fimbrial protein [Klebsiella oxytoca]
MTNKMMKPCFLILAGLVLSAVTMPSRANSDSMIVNISGSIFASTCTVNTNKPITVEFGTVQVSQLASATASVPVTIACDTTPSGTLSMEIQGTASSFDAQVLATDVPGLGIALGSKGTTQYGMLDLNTFYDVSTAFGLTSKTGSFSLSANLISDGTTTLAGGEFNASATLVLQMS